MGLLNRIFGDTNEKAVRRLNPIVEQVNALEPEFASLDAGEFAGQTALFKEQLSQGATLDDILPRAFALVREASRRTIGMRPFDVQVLGAAVLHQGRIAEMKTGEGKTLVATMPAYLNALTGRGVHIVTVNDYLARRDSEWMGPVYRILGMKVGLIVHGLTQQQRREAYAADVLYATNNELGFDYLRDNMVIYKERLVQRELHYAIIDEVDSILIDEARTPLIISSRVESTQDYTRWKNPVENLLRKQARLVNELIARAQQNLEAGQREEAAEQLFLARRGAPKNKRLLNLLREQGVERLVERTKQRLMTEKRVPLMDEELFFVIDEITRGVSVSQKGYRELVRGNPELARLLGFEEAAGAASKGEEDEDSSQEIAGEHLHCIHQLLKAYSLYERDVEYVVQEGRVIIVDEFTGRLMWGRRYSDGLHQAIEAKEGVAVQDETRTVASITFQNFFRMYDKLAGMTGTAATEEEEFRKIYGMDVVVIPTNRPLIRRDLGDMVYKTERAKFKAVVEDIRARHERGQPVLVGTISVEKSEMLSKMLKRQGIPHQVLNAVNHSREAQIIAQAGRKGAVTISTNMAGRGTDIILGGNPEFRARERLNKEMGPLEEETDPHRLEERERRFRQLLKEESGAVSREREEVLATGGLHVLGTERHESRRIDNQLRGRSGRQGDPGSSQFYISLQDDLMRLFGADNISALMDRFGMEEDQPIDHPLVGRAIERAQKKVEGRNFEIRKHLLDYDDVLNQQRETIYSQRRRILEGEEMRQVILDMVETVIDRRLQYYFLDKSFLEVEEAEKLLKEAESYFLRRGRIKAEQIQDRDREEVRRLFLEEARAFYEEREREIGAEIMRELERVVLLRTVDSHWVDQLEGMHDLRQGINLRAYAQRDPLVEYRHEGYEMFEAMTCSIEDEVVRHIYRVKVAARPQRQAVIGTTNAVRPAAVPVGGSTATAAGQTGGGVASPKVGRNEPCPCGSGKKYKKCCGS